MEFKETARLPLLERLRAELDEVTEQKKLLEELVNSSDWKLLSAKLRQNGQIRLRALVEQPFVSRTLAELSYEQAFALGILFAVSFPDAWATELTQRRTELLAEIIELQEGKDGTL